MSEGTTRRSRSIRTSQGAAARSRTTGTAADQQQHHHQQQKDCCAEAELESAAEALTEQFADTVRSLAREAILLRQMAGLVACLEASDDGDGSSPTDSTNSATREEALAQLVRLDAVVSGLERKLTSLQEAADQEEEAVHQLRTLTRQADRQGTVLEAMLRSLPAGAAPPATTEQEKEKENAEKGATNNERTTTNSKNEPAAAVTNPPAVGGSNENKGRPLADHGSPPAATRASRIQPPSRSSRKKRSPRDNNSTSTPRDGGTATTIPGLSPITPAAAATTTVTTTPVALNLSRISERELSWVPRTIRGRVSRAVINEAIDDLVLFARSKSAVLAREAKRREQVLRWKHHGGISGSSITPDQQLRTGSGGGALSSLSPPLLSPVDGPSPAANNSSSSSELSVSEQELRQSCAFFRFGESTARSVLLILRNLHRLRQIPSKTGDAVYVIALTNTGGTAT